jgi:hypothetical protein
LKISKNGSKIIESKSQQVGITFLPEIDLESGARRKWGRENLISGQF